MNKTLIALVAAGVVTALTLYICDLSLIVTTPLTPYGANHWIPESVFLFFAGYYVITRKLSRFVVNVIVICLLIYPALTFGLMYSIAGVMRGIGTGSFFLIPFLMGIWIASKREEQN